MNRVNPPKQVVLPLEIQQNPALKKAFNDAYFIMFQMWKRMGGGDDWVDESRETTYEFDDIAALFESLVEPNSDVVSASVDYTTVTSQVVICVDALTVYLNESPDDRETATVKITNGDVTINAGSRAVDGQDEITILFEELQGLATLDIIYLAEVDEWFII